jgi:Ankyrin repeats (many copies)/TIR domain
MTKLFVSYRRSDSADAAGRIYDRLVAEFSRENVFKDVDCIPLSASFPDYLRDTLRKANAVLVVIGPTWLTTASESRESRLQDPADYVRMEVETALRLGIPTIPVTVSNAVMPQVHELPGTLLELCARNGQAVRPDPDFHRDMDRLVARLRVVLDLPAQADQAVNGVDASMLELERILVRRAERVEEWLNKRQATSRSRSSRSQYGEALDAFRRLHKQHVEALRRRQFVLAHETLREIHQLLRHYDSVMYNRPAEYGYEYPGNLDSEDMYSVLKRADTSIKSQLVRSLFVGMESNEYAQMQANSNFQFTLGLNTGVSLVRAVCEQDLAMVQALLDAGFHPDIRVTSRRDEPKGENSTPLMFAAYRGNREIVEELLQKGANVNAKNDSGETAADVARNAGREDMVSILSAKGE